MKEEKNKMEIDLSNLKNFDFSENWDVNKDTKVWAKKNTERDQSKPSLISYVGYTNNLKKRLYLHNNSKGAKFTKGRFWKLVYFKTYKTKIKALKDEYKLKKDYKLRSNIKKKYLRNENINFITL